MVRANFLNRAESAVSDRRDIGSNPETRCFGSEQPAARRDTGRIKVGTGLFCSGPGLASAPMPGEAI